MNHITPRVFGFIAIVSVFLLVVFFVPREEGKRDPYTFDLIVPGFVQNAHAEEDATLAGIVDEAGIAGYFQTDGPITINNTLRSVFRTVEDDTETYIVGSVPVPGFPESYDVHAFVHTDGWIMIYYLKADPVGKIFDWAVYTSAAPTIVTVFETVAPIVAGAAGKPYTGLSFYDFRYPNANQMTLIAEDNATEDNFTVQLPASYVYSEYSWSLKSLNDVGCGWNLNNVLIGSVTGQDIGSGLVSAGQMLPDVSHTVRIRDYSCEGGLALVYRVP